MKPPSGTGAHPESAPVASSTPTTAATPDDELPDWEPLTPELVEDEALRGDAMLRNAVLLLAVLFGWTQISDTALLVRIKTGQFLAQHGILPPATDPFSCSAGERPWINLGWLSDLVLAATQHVGQFIGIEFGIDGKALTLWGAVAGFVSFWLVSRCSMKGLPTWWSSIVAAVAVVAAYPAMTAGPASVTLIGVATLLWLLFRASEKSETVSAFPFALLFLLWSNFDPLAWLGLALLWAAALGKLAPYGEQLKAPRASSGSLLKVAAIATIAALVHPFHWHVLEAPFVLFGTELPAARGYGFMGPHFRWMLYAIGSPQSWSAIDNSMIAGIVLSVATLLTLILNIGKIRIAHVALYLVANGLALKAGLFLPAASVVNAVLAGLNGQAWYSRTFRQTYSIAWTELLFSRAGRAVTVLGLFALAYLMINGALPGVDGRRLGMGFDWRIKTAVASYKTLASHTQDPRAFNGRPDHGDLMIWAGLRPFTDSRLALYARGPENLLDLHRSTLRALWVKQPDAPGTGEPTIWKATFDRFFIRHAYARLTGDDLALRYNLLLRFVQNPELKLADLDAAAARLDRADLPAAVAANPVTPPQIGIDFIQQAFRGADDPVVGVPAWPRELTTYERWLIQPEPVVPTSGQLAQHYAVLATELAPRLGAAARPGETSHALRILAIRQARTSLMIDPNTPQVYQVLRQVYPAIIRGEQGFGQFGALNELRIRQLLAADFFSLLTSSGTAGEHEALAYRLASIGHRDVALVHLQAVFAKTGAWTSLSPLAPNFNQLRDENQKLLKDLEQSVKEVQKNANREIQRGEDPVAVARSTFDAGCPLYALSILEQRETDVVRDPMASLLLAQLLMAVGRMEESWERLEGVESLFPPDNASPPGTAEIKSVWRSNTAVANMIHGDVERALGLWTEEATQLSKSAVRSALDALPLTVSTPMRQDLAGLAGARAAADLLYNFPERWAMTQLLIAVSEIEQGRLSKARTATRLILEKTPAASIRPLAAYYHQLLTGEAISPAPPISVDDAKVESFLDDGSIAGSADREASPPPPPVAVPLE